MPRFVSFLIVSLTAVLMLLLLLACESADTPRSDGTDADADGDTDADSDGDSDSDSDSDTDDECLEGLDLIYVVDNNNLFYTFDPTKSTVNEAFQQVGGGTLSCPSGGQPFSMSVGRDGYAYVLFVQSDLISFSCTGVNRVSTETGVCEGLVPYTCGSNGQFPQTFGMGYVTDGPETSAERMYVGASGQSGEGNALGTLNVTSGALDTVVANLPGAGPEFTGNQLGELWGFFPQGNPPFIAEIDKTTGGFANQSTHYFELAELAGTPESWAFAYWGDAFYIFFKKMLDNSTVVYRLGMDGTKTVHLSNTGFNIVGAGVSTCAPTIIE